MAVPVNKKVNIVLGMLGRSGSQYRVWYWQNYKPEDKNNAFRAEWASVLGRFTCKEIRDGMVRWSKQYGVEQPPLPQAFADYLRPKHTQISRQHLSSIKQQLAG